MDWKMTLTVVIGVILLASRESLAKAVTETIENVAPSGHQCEYGGRTYQDGDDLPTSRLCLACKCSKDFLEPNDVYCSAIQCPQTNHLELGCMPVYNDTECCPVEWKCDQHDTSKCDKRYFKHYSVKRCIPEYDEGEDCPRRFKCPDVKDLPHYENECEFQGRLYKEGDDIDVNNPCRRCSCRKGWKDDAMEISCISVECASAFGHHLNSSCHYVYEDGKCCPRTKCSDPSEVTERTEKTCEYGGQSYNLGDKIYPEEDPCLICICDENWTGILGSSCRVHDCSLEIKRDEIVRGCLPIYHEATCCPIEFNCGSKEEGFLNTTKSLANNDDIGSGNTCVFKGVHYKIGQILDINHPTHCVTCACSTPPDFTCIHKQCPRPPNNDYENYRSTYTPGQCCATYSYKNESDKFATPAEIACSPIQCPKGCQEVTVHNSCPFCQCEGLLCSPPKCPPGCHVEQSEEGKCPECQCPESVRSLVPQCSPVKCNEACYEVIGPLGCGTCVCGPLCSPPKCDPGCHVERNVPDGECPGCICEDDSSTKGSLQCSPVKCPAICMETVGESGCPSCLCPVCSSPKCDPGCHVDLTSPLSPGECPGCICEDEHRLALRQCSTVKCGPLCHEAYDSRGCPSCICDPICSPPVCEGSCRLEYDPANGPCPSCVCTATSLDECPKVKCGPECQERIGADGCTTCFCGPACTPPKCANGCHLEYDASAGPCPACVCPSEKITNSLRPQCSIPICDRDCVVDYSARPCPSCTCGASSGVQCSAPKCEVGCHIDFDAQPCPVCDCSNNTDISKVMCSIPERCDPMCEVDYNAKPCPTCSCPIPHQQTVRCSVPNCEVGCYIEHSYLPCPTCKCGVRCSPPKCRDGCEINYSTRPCPSCKCPESLPRAPLACSSPACDVGCYVDYSTEPCPSCKCGDIACDTPTCPGNCVIDYLARPCPACSCPSQQCGEPKCGPGCQVDTSTPCPSCKCPHFPVLCGVPLCENGCVISMSSGPCPSCRCPEQKVPCSTPKCRPGCRVDKSTWPCPSCKCTAAAPTPNILCTPPTCNAPCRIDYDARPCPVCMCGNSSSGGSDILCSPPICEEGCRVDYSTKPCPTCVCVSERTNKVQCKMPRCRPDCHIDYSTLPCPSCKCSGSPAVRCSVPKCDDPGCQIDYQANPCPICTCVKIGPPAVHCSPPQCDSGCTIDTTTQPCPSCKCGDGSPEAHCSVPKCDDPGCRVDHNAKPCPTCICVSRSPPSIQCATPMCAPGCTIDNSAHPCPTCKCGNGHSSVECAIPMCASGCTIDNSAHPCPTCKCSNASTSLHCSPPSCDPSCDVVTGNEGCPTCDCSRKPLCSVPNCAAGCRIDPNTQPCPTCVCDRLQRTRYPTGNFMFLSDPYCRTLRCGPLCEMDSAPPGPNDRCPMCICRGNAGEGQKCPPMHCQLPCRWKRVSEHACPMCMCFNLPSIV